MYLSVRLVLMQIWRLVYVPNVIMLVLHVPEEALKTVQRVSMATSLEMKNMVVSPAIVDVLNVPNKPIQIVVLAMKDISCLKPLVTLTVLITTSVMMI